MTKEQAAAYVFAMSVSAMAEIEGMKAENQMYEIMGEYPTQTAIDFQRVIDQHGLTHNEITALLQGATP